MTGHSQINVVTNVKQNPDISGLVLKNTAVKPDIPYSAPAMMTSYSYDSVRALTEINDPTEGDAYPWISPDGLRLYYTHGTSSGTQFWFTQRADTNSYFVTPVVVPIALGNLPLSCWLSTDELDMYITKNWNDSLFCTHRNTTSSAFGTPVQINLLGIKLTALLCTSLNTAQDELFLCAKDSTLNDAIYKFSRISSTSFTYTGKMTTPTGYYVELGQLSKDNLAYFLCASHNSGKAIIYQMTRSDTAASFDTNTFQQVQGINDFSVVNLEPSMSDNLYWVAFVRSVGDWNDDNLYLAHKGTITSVFNLPDGSSISSAFPNPASEYFTIRFRTSSTGPIHLSIFSSTGTLLEEQMVTPATKEIRINTKVMNNGFYFYTLSPFDGKKTDFATGKFVVVH
jgi:hypothetical protein